MHMFLDYRYIHSWISIYGENIDIIKRSHIVLMRMCTPALPIYYWTKLWLSVFQLNKGLDVNLAEGHPVGFKLYCKNKYVLRLIQLYNNNNNNNKPDIIIRDNEKRTRMLIDVAISGDRNVIKKEAEKILKY